MASAAIKLLRLGYSEAKKHKAKNEQANFQQPPPAPGYPYQYPPQPYPMAEYPPGVTPGTTAQYPPPEPAPAPAPKPSKIGSMIISAFRFLQFIMGMTVIGLYGRDVQHDNAAHHTMNPKWVYAVTAAFLATMTAAMHMLLPCCLRRLTKAAAPNGSLYLPQFIWEFVLCILWLTLFGIFGKMYISPSSTSGLGGPSKISRMRHALWVDLINLGFWAITTAWVLMRWMKARRANQVGDAEK